MPHVAHVRPGKERVERALSSLVPEQSSPAMLRGDRLIFASPDYGRPEKTVLDMFSQEGHWSRTRQSRFNLRPLFGSPRGHAQRPNALEMPLRLTHHPNTNPP